MRRRRRPLKQAAASLYPRFAQIEPAQRAGRRAAAHHSGHVGSHARGRRTNAPAALLDVEDLHVVYRSHGRDAHVLNGVSLSIASGETLGLVGESGSGKTTIGKTILGQVV